MDKYDKLNYLAEHHNEQYWFERHELSDAWFSEWLEEDENAEMFIGWIEDALQVELPWNKEDEWEELEPLFEAGLIRPITTKENENA